MDIDNARENSRRVTYDYAIGYLVYVEMTDIYHKLDYKKQGMYIIIEVITHSTVKFQRVKLNKHINTRHLRINFI